jgi:hypothetical protein
MIRVMIDLNGSRGLLLAASLLLERTMSLQQKSESVWHNNHRDAENKGHDRVILLKRLAFPLRPSRLCVKLFFWISSACF